MKKIKIFVLLVILGLIALIGYQNLGFLVVNHQFGINLLFFKYQTPEIANFVLLLAFFLAGLLLAYLSTLRGRWKSGREIKALTREVVSFQEKTAALENELAGLKNLPQNLEVAEGDVDVSS